MRIHIRTELSNRLPGNVYTPALSFCTSAYESEFTKTKRRHLEKFTRLEASYKRTNDAHNISKKDKWVINLSDKDLSEDQHAILSRGLNYAVTPSSVPCFDIITAVEAAVTDRSSGLSAKEASDISFKTANILKNAKVPKSNISRGEMRAIRELKSDTNIVILPSDKGRATVLMNKTV